MAMTKTIQATVKNRTDTAANWTQKNPVLAEGEIIVVQTSAGETRLKIGDGVKTFTQLPYTDEQIYNNVVTSVNGQTGDVTLDIPGGGADWTQNDPDGDGYIKNRPGGYMTDPVVTDVDTFTITSAKDEGGIYFAVVAVESSTIMLSDYAIGDSVIVDFGGQSYSLTWQSIESMPACGAAVTEEGLDWSSAPFCIMAVFGQEGGLRGYYVYLQNAVTSPIQVKLTMAKQTPVKIPEKYLDLDSAKEIVLFTISYNQSSKVYESDRTYDELKAALDAGKTVLAKFRNVMGEFYNYGLLYQRAMYVPGIWVYVGGSDPCEWQCAEGNKWTKRQLLRLSTGIGEPKKAGTAAYGTSEYASRDDHVHPSELPDVSADDDGKLLGVTGGVWGKVDKPSGGASDFIVNVTSTDDINCTLDKTFDQIQEAIQAGKKVYAKLNGIFIIYMPMVLQTSFVLIFAATAFTSESIEQYVLTVPKSNSDGNNPQFLKKSAVTYNSDPTTGEKTMPQVDMSEDPVNNMQIATKKYVDNSLWYGADTEMSDTSTHPVRNMVIKKYVDDKISDKEIILSSSTAGSTKKFKLTIDDTGTLTASEIMA